MIEDIIRQISVLQRRVDGLISPEIGGFSSIPNCWVELSASAASVTLPTSGTLPQQYRHLLLVYQARTDDAGSADAVNWQANGDTGNNYDTVLGSITTGGLSTSASRAAASAFLGQCEAAGSRADNFGLGFGLFVFYSKSTQEKWSIALSTIYRDTDADTDLVLTIRSGRWRDTDAITSILLLPVVGSNFVSGSIFELYGLL